MNTSTFTRRMFAVFVGLTLLTTGIRADVVPFSETYNSESTTEGWTTATEGRYTPVILSDNDDYFLSVDQSQRSTGAFITGTILNGKAAAGDDFTLSFDMRLGNSGGNYAQSPTSIKFLDADGSGVVFSLVASRASGASITDVPEWHVNNTAVTVDLPNSGYSYYGISQITWCSYKITRWQGLTFLTIKNRETGEVIFERNVITGASAKGGLGNIEFDGKRYRSNLALDNIILRAVTEEDVPSIVPVNYTVRYRNDNQLEIKGDTTIVSYVGAKVAATPELLVPVMCNGQKYLYKEGNDSILLVENTVDNVITLTYRMAENYHYTVNATDAAGNILKTIAAGLAYENDEVVVPYPTYLVNDGKLMGHLLNYQQYADRFVLSEDNITRSISYTDKGVDNVVFYTEAEDVQGMTPYREGNSYVRSSQCASAYAESDVKFTTLEPGSYKLNFVLYAPSLTEEGRMTFVVGDEEMTHSATASNWSAKPFTFYIDKTSDVILKKGGNENSCVDLIWIQRLNTEPQFVAQFNRADSTLIFKKGIADNSTYAWDASDTSSGTPRWYSYRNYVTKVIFDKSFAEARPKSCRYWFWGYSKLRDIEGIENLNTEAVTDMGGMFNECVSLKSLDVSHFNTENVTDMYYMFRQCQLLKDLDVSHFDTHNVTDMGWMFCGCYALENLDVSYFNTENVTRMTSMFWWCSDLKTIDVSHFNTEKVCDTGWMFNGCMWLEKLDLSNFNTANDTVMNNMFYYCTSLKELDLRSFNTAKVKEMDWMFRDCWNLETITVGDSWTNAQVAAADSMFYDCESLVGGAGTRYDSTHINYTYARVDGGADAPGYFTAATSSAILTHKRETGRKGNIYSLAGQKLNRPQRGVVIEGGKKAIVK